MSLVTISRRLSGAVDAIDCSAAAAYVYNPLAYARRPHEKYLHRYGNAPKEVLLVGMNPGPFGMAQTGVPFGDVAMVRDFLGIEDKVDVPHKQHPKRPVAGFGCARAEVSGSRLWGWAKERFGTADAFFSRFFVHNYCPLVFMEAGGKNLTPDKLPKNLRDQLFSECDLALCQVVKKLRPQWVVGIGGFAEKRARDALADRAVGIGCILHPSPASPLANKGWARQAEQQLKALGIQLR